MAGGIHQGEVDGSDWGGDGRDGEKGADLRYLGGKIKGDRDGLYLLGRKKSKVLRMTWVFGLR